MVLWFVGYMFSGVINEFLLFFFICLLWMIDFEGFIIDIFFNFNFLFGMK